MVSVSVLPCRLETVLELSGPVTSPAKALGVPAAALQLCQLGALPVVATKHWPLVPAAVAVILLPS